METLYTASDKISQECRIGTRKEWEESLEESMHKWFGDDVQKGEVEEGTSFEEYMKMKLDSELTESSDDQINDSDYERLTSELLTEQYRFIEGSLYKYNKHSNSYIHCYRNAFVTTKKTAIKMYEEKMLREAC